MDEAESQKHYGSECSTNSSSDEDEGGRVRLKNPNLNSLKEDVLYHFALSTGSHDLQAMFGDVKFVCIGGSPRRMEKFANYIKNELHYRIPAGQTLVNIAQATDRYALYKVGPVLAVSHGMGEPSINIMLHEIFKLLHHAQAKVQGMLRLGTCGGIGLEPGTVVVTQSAVNALLQPELELAILGKLVKRPAVLDPDLADEVCACSLPGDEFKVIKGKTMCTMDFYEGQGRLDGAFCEYTEGDKMQYLQHLYKEGVRNIEMESLCFAAMCHHANIKGAVVCVALLDRLKGDQVDTPTHILKAWDERPALIAARLIKKRLGIE